MILVIDTHNGRPYNAIAYADKNEALADQYIERMKKEYSKAMPQYKLYKLACCDLVFPK